MADRKRGRPAHEDVLTPAEWAVAEGVRHGLTNRQIAKRRNVSIDAVKFHIGNILAKLGLGDRGALRHWTGICRQSAAAGRETEMVSELQLGPVGQVARTVSQLDQSTLFYRDTLGLALLFSTNDMAFFDCDGVRLYLQQGEAGPESILYFSVADIHAAHETLADRNVKILSAPHMVHKHENGTEEWMAFIEDPDGRPLGLMASMSAQ